MLTYLPSIWRSISFIIKEPVILLYEKHNGWKAWLLLDRDWFRQGGKFLLATSSSHNHKIGWYTINYEIHPQGYLGTLWRFQLNEAFQRQLKDSTIGTPYWTTTMELRQVRTKSARIEWVALSVQSDATWCRTTFETRHKGYSARHQNPLWLMEEIPFNQRIKPHENHWLLLTKPRSVYHMILHVGKEYLHLQAKDRKS